MSSKLSTGLLKADKHRDARTMKNPFENLRFPGSGKYVSRRTHYAELKEAILRCTPGSPVEPKVIAYLFDLRSNDPDEFGRAWPSVRTIMNETGAGRRAVFYALQALEGRGEILTLRKTQPLSRPEYASSTRIIGKRNVREYKHTYLAQGGASRCTGGVQADAPYPTQSTLDLSKNRPGLSAFSKPVDNLDDMKGSLRGLSCFIGSSIAFRSAESGTFALPITLDPNDQLSVYGLGGVSRLKKRLGKP